MSIAVRGQSELAAMPSSASSTLSPNVTRLIPYFAIVYAVWVVNHLGSRLIGGDSVRMWALSDFLSHSIDDLASRNEPRALMSFIRSYFFIDTSSVFDRSIALALLTTMSMPPNSSAVLATASRTKSSSRMSPTSGRALPPAASIASAAV